MKAKFQSVLKRMQIIWCQAGACVACSESLMRLSSLQIFTVQSFSSAPDAKLPLFKALTQMTGAQWPLPWASRLSLPGIACSSCNASARHQKNLAVGYFHWHAQWCDFINAGSAAAQTKSPLHPEDVGCTEQTGPYHRPYTSIKASSLSYVVFCSCRLRRTDALESDS